jgi:hypothetical protein
MSLIFIYLLFLAFQNSFKAFLQDSNEKVTL